MSPIARKIFFVVLCLGALSALPSARAQSDTYSPNAPKAKTPDRNPAKNPPPAKSNPPLKDQGRSLFGPSAKPAAAPAWSIVIRAFREEDQAALAREGLVKVQTQGGLPDAYLEKRGEATVIAYGHYTDPTDKAALADLKRIHDIEVVMDGVKAKPFAPAFLAPPEEIKGTLPQYDLRNARKDNGDWVLYTLQVGVYGRGDNKPASPAELQEFRDTAEKAVLQLRREGEHAYYFHGPYKSEVTIGLFGKEDFDNETKVDSPALRALRQRFPYNLQNGMGIKQRLKATNPETGKTIKIEQLQKSALVNVP